MEMIWYFLAGFISGIVGTVMFSRWAVTHIIIGGNGNDKRTGTDQKDLDRHV